MDKKSLSEAASKVRRDWESTIDELGPEGLKQTGATGKWRVRDVLAHFNAWDRWQLVQLRCAFTGETPSDLELTGGVEYPPNDDMSEDAMNAMFEAGNRNRPIEDIIKDWHEISDMRADWIAGASQEELETVVGSDWSGGTNRIVRLASEVPSVTYPEKVWQRLADQIEHQRAHLQVVRDWMDATAKS